MKARHYAYVLSFVAALGGFLFGFDTAIIAAGLRYLKEQFVLDSVQEGWAASSALLGCIAGAAAAGVISDWLGRKRVLMLAAVLFTVSAVGSAIAATLTAFVAARIIGGVAVGAAAALSPLYIGEIAPPDIRGRLVSFQQLAIVTGILLSYLAGWALAGIGPTNWRWMFGVETFPAIAFLTLLAFVPESPRWLMRRGRKREAEVVLARVSSADEASRALHEIARTVQAETGSFRQLLEPGFRYALLIGCLVAIAQQVTGINAVVYYAPRIFESAGFERTSALLQSTLLGVVYFVFTWVAIVYVDRWGRKPLLIVGAAGMGTMLFFTGLAFHSELFSGVTVLVFVLAYAAFFCIALGPVCWVVLAEIFPTHARGTAMSIAGVCMWSANWAVTQTFPIMADRLHESVTFWIYAGMCVLAVVFFAAMLPETKHKSLEQIEAFFRR